MKRIFTKPCPFCDKDIIGRKRADRNAYHYAPRCPQCAYKTFDPALLIKKQNVARANKVVKPIGSKQLHHSRGGVYYVKIKIADPNKWEYEHRVVMGALPGQHVHHKNHDTLDNRIENLVLLTPQEHKKAHQLTQWSVKYLSCQGCDTTQKKHISFGLCSTCYQRRNAGK